MKSRVLKETKSFAEDIQAQVLSGLSLEPTVVQRFSNEVDRLRKDLNYRKSPPLEKLMVEQVLVAHTQNMVALHNLETIPINVDIPGQKRYLEERVTVTQLRLIRAVCVLSSLQRIGRQLDSPTGTKSTEAETFPPGMRPAQQFSESELKGSSVDYLDEDETSDEDRQRNAAIRQYWADREARWQGYRETAEDLKPRRLVRLVYKAVERRED